MSFRLGNFLHRHVLFIGILLVLLSPWWDPSAAMRHLSSSYGPTASFVTLYTNYVASNSKIGQQQRLSSPSSTTTPINTSESILMDPKATHASDVFSIHHFADQSKLVVELSPNATCPKPFWVGRLSGQALIAVEWEWTSSTTLEGRYQAPMVGHYFVEIIELFCHDFVHDLQTVLQAQNNTSMDTSRLENAMSIDFRGTCMEDIAHHRLTAEEASIQVMTATIQPVGVWKASATANNNQTFPPLYTRTQPQQCYEASKRHEDLSPDCVAATEVDRYTPYNFQFTNNLSVSNIQPSSRKTVCIVGFSHSRKLYEAAQRLQFEAHNISMIWVKARYPADVTLDALQAANCDAAVIGVGQWPGSFAGGSPTFFNQYYREIVEMMQRLQAPSISPKIEIYLRSIHYNPLGYALTACPPKDWRSPPVIDAYNGIIEYVAQQMHANYLNTNAIVAPVWDSGPDWCHLNVATSDAEALYIVAYTLGMIDHNNNDEKSDRKTIPEQQQ